MTRVWRGSTGTMWSMPAKNCAVVSRTSSESPWTVTSVPSDVMETWVTSQSSSRTRTTEPGATLREGAGEATAGAGGGGRNDRGHENDLREGTGILGAMTST